MRIIAFIAMPNSIQNLIVCCAIIALTAVTSCQPPQQQQVRTATETKRVELTIQDIRGKNITYDFYQVRGGEDLEYVSTEVADKDGQTIVSLEIDQDINNIIVKRTKSGVEKRQVVPIRGTKMTVQFLL